jgi:hypothetical protein
MKTIIISNLEQDISQKQGEIKKYQDQILNVEKDSKRIQNESKKKQD